MSRSKRGFTLVEMLVVIAIIGILMFLILPAVQSARESGRSIQCRNNLRQLAMAVNAFNSRHNYMPTYQGLFPPHTDKRIMGNWFVHMLPDLEERGLYDMISSQNGYNIQKWVTVVVTPASPNYQPAETVVKKDTSDPNYPNGGYYENYNCVTTTTDAYQNIGHGRGGTTITTCQTRWVGPKDIVETVAQVGTAAVTKDVKVPGANWHYVDYRHFPAETQQMSFTVLQCYSDPSNLRPGDLIDWKYKDVVDTNKNYNRTWSLSNYQANVHAFAIFDRYRAKYFDYTSFRYDRPSRLLSIHDGLSNTILFAEGMRECDGDYRFAFWSRHTAPHSHNFGIDWDFNAGTAKTHKSINTYMFQRVARRALCNNWRVQGMHNGNINVAMADASVRSLNYTISHREITDFVTETTKQTDYYPIMGTVNGVWDLLIMPDDGQELPEKF